ncbi:hypothetical protein BDF19DRAFT_423275 [Syncephalis fuscata]|nr:hypothetical protein BDF19DRAFT_423275 [Syncephalis fuscata]
MKIYIAVVCALAMVLVASTAMKQCISKDSNGGVLGCPMYKLKAGCYMTSGNPDAEYPDCCPQPVCPKSYEEQQEETD